MMILDEDNNRIILTGGGTAGHVTPNLALIPKLEELGFEIHYIGRKSGIEKELVGKTDCPILWYQRRQAAPVF